MPEPNTQVDFTDLSTGSPVSWNWSFTPSTVNYLNSTSSTSQNPQTEFTATGYYTVSLTVSDGSSNDTETKTDYIHVQNCSVSSFPWTEDFENGGNIPNCWTQEYETGTINWGFQNGGQNGHPSSAHGGSYNGIFYYGGSISYVAKLVTPPLDLSGLSNVQVNFWHTQAKWRNDQDELRIYYKTSANSSWILLQTWTNNITSWAEETIILPNTTSTYFIAFEGTTDYGYGVCIDDVSVDGDIPGLWNGTTSNDWNLASNWDDGQVPDETTDVVIPGGRSVYPFLSGDLYINSSSGVYHCRSLIIKNGAELNLNQGIECRIFGDVTVETGGTLNLGN